MSEETLLATKVVYGAAVDLANELLETCREEHSERIDRITAAINDRRAFASLRIDFGADGMLQAELSAVNGDGERTIISRVNGHKPLTPATAEVQ